MSLNGMVLSFQHPRFSFNLLPLLFCTHYFSPTRPNPRVRATYVTPAQGYKVSPEFLYNMKQPAGDYRTPGQPSIFQVTREKFIPTLLPSELEKIDNTVARGNYSTKRKDDKPSVRDQVGL